MRQRTPLMFFICSPYSFASTVMPPTKDSVGSCCATVQSAWSGDMDPLCLWARTLSTSMSRIYCWEHELAYRSSYFDGVAVGAQDFPHAGVNAPARRVRPADGPPTGFSGRQELRSATKPAADQGLGIEHLPL